MIAIFGVGIVLLAESGLLTFEFRLGRLPLRVVVLDAYRRLVHFATTGNRKLFKTWRDNEGLPFRKLGLFRLYWAGIETNDVKDFAV